ncbi:MAG: response regulator [Candidatus Omnitrophica bacterium]|nr:response regulator [Candidatus Omnitrophota bacterium]
MKNKILIIEDEKIITKSLQKLLQEKGYEVTIAYGGADALTKIQNDDFHMIVCDIRMPEMDGIETIKSIRDFRQKQGKAPIPEVFITGFVDEDKYKSAVNLKVAGYLHKPFDTNEFLEIIERNLDT